MSCGYDWQSGINSERMNLRCSAQCNLYSLGFAAFFSIAIHCGNSEKKLSRCFSRIGYRLTMGTSWKLLTELATGRLRWQDMRGFAVLCKYLQKMTKLSTDASLSVFFHNLTLGQTSWEPNLQSMTMELTQSRHKV